MKEAGDIKDLIFDWKAEKHPVFSYFKKALPKEKKCTYIL